MAHCWWQTRWAAPKTTMGTAANIFWINNGTQSSANSQIFKVYLKNNNSVGVHDLNEQSISTLGMQVYPNPSKEGFSVKFNLRTKTEVKLSLYNIEGKVIEEKTLTKLIIGENIYQHKITMTRGTYILLLETPYDKAKQKIIIKP